jgi:hypothetical protein
VLGFNVVAGLDGFVDELIEVVDERQGLDAYRPVPTIARFAQLLAAAAGRSSLREIVVKRVDPGGCAVNLGDGLAHLGVGLDYFGTLGEPHHPAFADFAAHCRSCRSLGVDPGHTLALEFHDGKYMLSSMSQLGDFTPDLLRARLADGEFARACAQAHLIALTNWTLYPHMTECWKLLQDQVFAALPQRPWFFIDLVDPRSRSRDDILAMLNVLSRFERFGPTILGGNLNESNVLANLLDIPQVHEEGPAVADQAAALRQKLQLREVAIHCIRGGAVAADDGVAWTDGPYTPHPRKSTGAGDRYNAGYCLGRLLDLDPVSRCTLGAGSSGYFVRNAHSGTLDQIADLLQTWAAGELT